MYVYICTYLQHLERRNEPHRARHVGDVGGDCPPGPPERADFVRLPPAHLLLTDDRRAPKVQWRHLRPRRSRIKSHTTGGLQGWDTTRKENWHRRQTTCQPHTQSRTEILTHPSLSTSAKRNAVCPSINIVHCSLHSQFDDTCNRRVQEVRLITMIVKPAEGKQRAEGVHPPNHSGSTSSYDHSRALQQ